MLKVINDSVKANELYSRYSKKIYIDGLRLAHEDNFFDSNGLVAWLHGGPNQLEGIINDLNTYDTGLTTSWGKLGDTWADAEYADDFKVCLCTN